MLTLLQLSQLKVHFNCTCIHSGLISTSNQKNKTPSKPTKKQNNHIPPFPHSPRPSSDTASSTTVVPAPGCCAPRPIKVATKGADGGAEALNLKIEFNQTIYMDQHVFCLIQKWTPHPPPHKKNNKNNKMPWRLDRRRPSMQLFQDVVMTPSLGRLRDGVGSVNI